VLHLVLAPCASVPPWRAAAFAKRLLSAALQVTARTTVLRTRGTGGTKKNMGQERGTFRKTAR
jgi:hypothetical protein